MSWSRIAVKNLKFDPDRPLIDPWNYPKIDTVKQKICYIPFDREENSKNFDTNIEYDDIDFVGLI